MTDKLIRNIVVFVLINAFIVNVFAATEQICRNTTCRYGECEQLSNGFQCHCLKGVQGTFCDKLLAENGDPCLTNPCWNGGTCKSSGSAWSCICPSGKTGINCKTSSSAPCLSNNPCKNNAVCQVIDNEGIFCYCTADYTGKYCESRLNLCQRPNPCYNGGYCASQNDKFCICPANFTGAQCETFVQPSTTKTVYVLNKGWYTAIAKLSYRYNTNRQEQQVTLLTTESYTFKYEFGNSNVRLQVEALAGPLFLDTMINNHAECYHVWGSVFYPVFDRVACS